jgi:hypothetical protein
MLKVKINSSRNDKQDEDAKYLKEGGERFHKMLGVRC